jgi:conjugal transfer pilus assembly protein TraB
LEQKKAAQGGDTANLNGSLPSVDFGAPTGGKKASVHGGDFSLDSPYEGRTGNGQADSPSMQDAPSQEMKVWGADSTPVTGKKGPEVPVKAIPVNAAMESVMLTGINARSNAAGGASVGSVMSANNVGAPFVARIKGSAILPNGWKVSDLGDCFIGGSGIAILSTDRANVISNRISCIDKKGVIYEGAIKAYGVDLDGNQGITGRVVTKQGAILAKTFMAGIASGLGTALSPTAIPGYNSNQVSGSTQGIQYPNGALIAQSSVGTGVSTAAAQLSKFYLDYAKEMFPVIEVDAGTRITWVLQETIELTPATGMLALKP